MTDKEILESCGYKLVSRDQFRLAEDRPDGILERTLEFAGTHVVYDPNDDDEGWLLVGDDPDFLAHYTVTNRCTPHE